MYDDLLDDPKVQRLPPPLFKVWVNLLCLASKHDGFIPCLDDAAFALRMDATTLDGLLGELQERGLIEANMGDDDAPYRPHNWDKRQFKSDRDDTAAERQKAKRERDKAKSHGPVTRDVTDESQPPETDTEQIQSRAEQNAGALREGDPKHWAVIRDIIDNRRDEVTDWELDFLYNNQWSQTLSKQQKDTLATIQNKLTAKTEGLRILPTVSRGTPAYEAWIKHFRAKGSAKFYEGRDAFTVPTEYPPAEKAA